MLQINFLEITLRHGYFPVNLLLILGTLFPRNTSGWLLLFFTCRYDHENVTRINLQKLDYLNPSLLYLSLLNYYRSEVENFTTVLILFWFKGSCFSLQILLGTKQALMTLGRSCRLIYTSLRRQHKRAFNLSKVQSMTIRAKEG